MRLVLVLMQKRSLLKISILFDFTKIFFHFLKMSKDPSKREEKKSFKRIERGVSNEVKK